MGETAAELIPAGATLDELRRLAAGCTACDLWRLGTQTVFGEGTEAAEMMLVGEQPGDREDREGRPFVGPAGRLLDRALGDADVPRERVYISNVVKHFKWKPKGKRRIHDTPNEREIVACRPWLQAEIDRVEPSVLVCVGATAAKALLGRSFRLTRHRGELFESDLGPLVTATLHPSAVLRAPDERRAELYAGLVEDLRGAYTAR
jgi:uracil-DNA glycosylase family protein